MSELTRLYQQNPPKPGETERARAMALLEAYYANTQYAGLPRAWDEALDANGQVIPFRMRRPSTIVPLPALVVDTFTRSLWATGRRPVPMLKDADDEQNVVLAALMSEAKIARSMREATRRALTTGTGVAVWKFTGGKYSTEAWDAKHCTPTFTPGCFPCLDRLEIRYPFTVEQNGKTVTMWHREVIDAQRWTVYQDVEVTADRDPKWREDKALSVDHKLGHVPAVWFTVGERSGVDGTGIFSSLLNLFDDVNYTASQQGRALYQNLDPQLALSGVNDADVDEMRKGGNTWCLPAGAEASLLESDGAYVVAADKRLDYLRKQILDACAVTIHDAERVKGAQSGTAIELLSAPMMARVSELREDVGDCALVPLLEQMLRHKMPGKSPVVALHWGSLAPTTTDDAKGAVEAATSAVDAGILSKQAAARYIAPYVGVVDPDHDQKQVEGLADAAVLDEANIPSPTFHRIRKTVLAKKHLGALATPQDHKAIEAELQRNITGEEYGDKPPELDDVGADEDEIA